MTTSSGLLLVDKPTGLTSHDVVARVRRLVSEKRVGHAGTLDPMATGLLVIAVGSATRLLRFAQGETKRYVGVVTFGASTDSLDADGVVLERRDVPDLARDTLNDVARGFCGAQIQVPPMVSALKVNGRRLHELAREGVVVERAPRPITVSDFVLAPTPRRDQWSFDVTCSPGTYVRVLLSDLAVRVGTLGHLSALRRVSSGSHHVDEALTLEQLGDRLARGESVLAPPRCFVEHLAQVVVDGEDVRRLRLGQRILLDVKVDLKVDETAVLDEGGALVAIVERRGDAWQPSIVLAPEDAAARG